MSDGKILKQDEEWGKEDDKVFERYAKSEQSQALNGKACLSCEW